MICVYFLTDGAGRKSYIGYTTDLANRYHTHKNKLKKAARYTKRFQGCILVAAISGFPSKRCAMSFEWFAKRRKLTCHKHKIPIAADYHSRLENFFAPLKDPKFSQVPSLTIRIDDESLGDRLGSHYHRPVEKLINAVNY